MAKIWAAYDGSEPTRGAPWAHLPLEEAVKLFELRQSDYLSDLEETPRFGDPRRDLTYAGYKHIVVEVEISDVQKSKWKPGYYKSRIKPAVARLRLIRQALAKSLGDKTIVRVASEPATDSQGRAAIRITVVISADAIQKLREGSALLASITLRERLREMQEDLVPIIEYATEAELKQDAGPKSRSSA
ncbi:MAG: hypothetical protein WD715_17770 [Dongiaceae bacterium]